MKKANSVKDMPRIHKDESRGGKDLFLQKFVAPKVKAAFLLKLEKKLFNLKIELLAPFIALLSDVYQTVYVVK